ncbi:hypothetical protein COB57_01345 [Candidatus Peregrinibacteria bacterium]|nr:MAG: hypothetical protein COB57_01345 [Candidatus Peregrinibacteria bacterium]
MKKGFLFFPLFFCFSAFVQAADIDIVSVVYGNENASDEYIEIKNNTAESILLKDFYFLHIVNSTGSSDSNKRIDWKDETIEPGASFYFVSKTSVSFLHQANALYSPSLVKNGAVYISKDSHAEIDVVSAVSWGEHVENVLFIKNLSDCASGNRLDVLNDSCHEIREEAPEEEITSENREDDIIFTQEPETSCEFQSKVIIQEIFLDAPDNSFIDFYNNENLEDFQLFINDEVFSFNEMTKNDEVITFRVMNNVLYPLEVSIKNQCGNIIDSVQIKSPSDFMQHRSWSRSESGGFVFGSYYGDPVKNELSEIKNMSFSFVSSPLSPTPEQPFVFHFILKSDTDMLSDDYEISFFFNGKKQYLSSQDIKSGVGFSLIYKQSAMNAGQYQASGNIVYKGQKIRELLHFSETIEVKLQPFISEIYPKARSEEVEWIEFFSAIDFDFSGTQMCYEQICFELSGQMKKNTLFTLDKNGIPSWESLPDKEMRIEWRRGDVTLDVFYYQKPHVGSSWIRNISGTIEEEKSPSRGVLNNMNRPPVAQLQVQGGQTVFEGPAPFSINLTGEESYDPDSKNIKYHWDFGNGDIFDTANPPKVTYLFPGSFRIILTVSDEKGGVDKKELFIHVYPHDFIINDGKEYQKPLEIIPQITAKSSVFLSQFSINSEEDFIEISCADCQKGIDIKGFSFYDDKRKYKITESYILQAEKPLKIFFTGEVKESHDGNIFVQASGFVKTDEQLIVLNASDEVIDGVCWSDMNDTMTNKETREMADFFSIGLWKGVCLSSKSIKKDDIFSRVNASEHSPMAWKLVSEIINEDIVREEIKEVKKEEIIVENFLQSGFMISEIMANPFGNDKILEWVELSNTTSKTISLKGWVLIVNTKKKTFDDIRFLPGEKKVFFSRDLGSITLPNTKATLFLQNPLGDAVDTVTYNSVDEGIAFAKNPLGVFQYTSLATPLRDNIIIPMYSGDFLDSDFDGVFDEVEKAYGTDPFVYDSVEKNIPDSYIIQQKKDKITMEGFRENLQKTTKVDLIEATSKNPYVKFAGKTEPGATVEVFIPSQNKTFKILADKRGAFSFVPENMDAGHYNWQYQVMSSHGILSPLSPLQSFQLQSGYNIEKEKQKTVLTEIFSPKTQTTSIKRIPISPYPKITTMITSSSVLNEMDKIQIFQSRKEEKDSFLVFSLIFALLSLGALYFSPK